MGPAACPSDVRKPLIPSAESVNTGFITCWDVCPHQSVWVCMGWEIQWFSLYPDFCFRIRIDLLLMLTGPPIYLLLKWGVVLDADKCSRSEWFNILGLDPNDLIIMFGEKPYSTRNCVFEQFAFPAMNDISESLQTGTVYLRLHKKIHTLVWFVYISFTHGEVQSEIRWIHSLYIMLMIF